MTDSFSRNIYYAGYYFFYYYFAAIVGLTIMISYSVRSFDSMVAVWWPTFGYAKKKKKKKKK